MKDGGMAMLWNRVRSLIDPVATLFEESRGFVTDIASQDHKGINSSKARLGNLTSQMPKGGFGSESSVCLV